MLGSKALFVLDKAFPSYVLFDIYNIYHQNILFYLLGINFILIFCGLICTGSSPGPPSEKSSS